MSSSAGEMKRKMKGEGETSRSTLQHSLCLRAITPRAPHLVWFLHNVSIGDEAMPTLQPCNKDKVRRLTKEAKKRDRYLYMKVKEYRRSKFTGERFEEEEAATLAPMRYTPDIPYESCWACLGSKIFCFGSRKRGAGFSNEVRSFNLFDDVEKGCEFGPPMMSPRRLGNALAVDDKVYVFGGTKEGSPGPWAEVFEKYDNIWRWRALTEPPFSLNLSNIYALPYAYNGVKKILFGSCRTKGLYAYCPIEDSSVVVDEEFACNGPSFTALVVVETTIYWVGDETVHAYDFGRKISFFGRTHFWAVKNALRISTVHRQPFALPFLHLRDNIFCLLWDEFDSGRDCPRSTFVLHKFRVLKRIDKNGGECSLSVKPLDMEYIVTDHHFMSFDVLLLSEPNEVVVPDEEKEENSDEEETASAEEEDED